MSAKLLVIDVAALPAEFKWDRLACRQIQSVLPALTCSVQGSFRTGLSPGRHGVVGNGWLVRGCQRVMFWEQSSALLGGGRIWDGFRSRGGSVGQMFWQQSLGEDVELLLSPSPIHKHHGGMIQDCYCQPAGLYDELCREIGGRFNLMRYWGPLASAKIGDWIAAATAAVLRRDDAPQLLLSYLPSLDYDLQRFGPTSKRCKKAYTTLVAQLDLLFDAATEQGYDVLIFGDYAMADVTGGAALPNVALREAGLLKVREVESMWYADLHASDAFAVVDHEIAHVYVRRPADVQRAREVLSGLAGVGDVFVGAELAEIGLDHPNSGELVLLAEPGWWLAYPWWTQKHCAPDFARHVDIHNKPGYDPCELFFGWPPMSITADTSRICGTHGLAGPGRKTAWATTLELSDQPTTMIELAEAVRGYLDEAI